ncbi:glycosyltransferase, partial [Pelagibacteraceae bacterium]|nr:glycosyltransferase [Pelagibacteraceae bacterium]
MYLIITRSFPPELGGMQNLMWGLTNALSKHYMVKVFADFQDQHEGLDQKVSFSITRVGGVKLLRKYRKAYLINELLKNNKNIKGVIADHWKSLELIQTNKKKICLIHSKEINHDKGTRLNKRVLNVLNNTDNIISNSIYTKDLAISCGVNINKITVINPGINPAEELDKSEL